MKKTLPFLLCAALLLCLTACMGGTSWAISGVRILDVDLTVEEFSELAGTDMGGMKIELKAEGTAVLTIPDLGTGELSEQTGHWEKVEGGYLITEENGDVTELIRQSGNRLVMDYGLYRITFTKQ